jgi:MoxR-like ATPase
VKFPFYKGDGDRSKIETTDLPLSPRSKLLKPEHYLADTGLVDACNIALLLGQPLLLTGEPGTGKTQFAYSLSWELGLEPILKFDTKSGSTAKDLFYTYDALKRFQDAQSGDAAIPLDYITFQALGLAILRSRAPSEVEQFLVPELRHSKKSRSVILIDEIDKAPRDFPNDLLNELEYMYFRIPEMGNEKIEADLALQPIVIVTSNSEKDLPDAFLRRCVYYNIPFPERKRLSEIIANRLGIRTGSRNPFLRSALDLFYRLRDYQSGLRKKPATAELLGWLLALQTIGHDLEQPLNRSDVVLRTISSLVKTAEDQEKAKRVVEQWMQEKQE